MIREPFMRKLQSGVQRTFACFVLCACVIAGVTGCSINQATLAETVGTYTNFAIETVQEETYARMVRTGISDQQIGSLDSWIDEYNDIMMSGIPLEGEYAETGSEQRPDFFTLYTAWWDNSDYFDILCRHVAFELLRHNIRIDNPLDESQWDITPAVFDEKDGELIVLDEGGWLQSDADIFKDGHFLDWNEETITQYYTLFAPVPIAEEANQTDWANAIQEAWSNYGTTFLPSGSSLVTVWIVDKQTNRLCVAHAGVLIEDSTGLLFVEKTDPLYPYRASTYQNIDDFVSILLSAREIGYAEYGEYNVKMLIMRNDEKIGQS